LLGGVNQYVYVKNRPVNYPDPYGLIIPGDPDPTDEILLIAAAAKASPQISRALGRAGEIAAGIVKNTERIISTTNPGKYRIPDMLDPLKGVIGEVKNVCYLYNSNQLRDFIEFAKSNGYRFQLYVRETTRISAPLQAALDDIGAIVERIL
jgi:hypothetical protein